MVRTGRGKESAAVEFFCLGRGDKIEMREIQEVDLHSLLKDVSFSALVCGVEANPNLPHGSKKGRVGQRVRFEDRAWVTGGAVGLVG